MAKDSAEAQNFLVSQSDHRTSSDDGKLSQQDLLEFVSLSLSHAKTTFNQATIEVPLNNPLLRGRVSEKTHQLYYRAARSFVLFYTQRYGSFPPINSADSLLMDHVDKALCTYVTELFLSNPSQSVNLANHAFNGLIYIRPHLKNNLQYTKAALKGWTRMKPWKSRPPIPWDMACIIAITLASSFSLPYGVATLLAFDCYLRISEVTALFNSDVVIPEGADGQSTSAPMSVSSLTFSSAYPAKNKTLIRLARTKTGDNKMVIVNRQPLSLLLTFLKTQVKPYQRLFPFSKFQFRRAFAMACEALHLDHFHFRPHSLRHGGASHDYLLGVKLEDIMIRGRWQSFVSVRRYLQSAKSLFIKQQQTFSPAMPLPILKSYEASYVVKLMMKAAASNDKGAEAETL